MLRTKEQENSSNNNNNDYNKNWLRILKSECQIRYKILLKNNKFAQIQALHLFYKTYWMEYTMHNVHCTFRIVKLKFRWIIMRYRYTFAHMPICWSCSTLKFANEIRAKVYLLKNFFGSSPDVSSYYIDQMCVHHKNFDNLEPRTDA